MSQTARQIILTDNFEADYERREAIMDRLRNRPFTPARWLRDAHLQTAWGPLMRKTPRINLIKTKLETPDDDFLHLYSIPGETTKPTVLLLHGLEGSAQSHSILALFEAFSQRGWNAASYNHRSCGEELNRARRLYHSGDTSDLRHVVQELIRQRPESRLYVAGFSFGGNQLLKCLGEWSDHAPEQLAGAAAISPPYDLAASAPHIAQALGGLYVRNFLSTMIPKALAKEKQYPGCLDRNAARKARNFEQYDTAVTAPLHGFEDCWDYYGQSSCGRYLAAIRKPTMFISSEDDPFYPASTLPSSEILSSPFIYPQFTPKGGHAGFVYGDWRAPRVWAEEQIVDFFQACEVLR